MFFVAGARRDDARLLQRGRGEREIRLPHGEPPEREQGARGICFGRRVWNVGVGERERPLERAMRLRLAAHELLRLRERPERAGLTTDVADAGRRCEELER